MKNAVVTGGSGFIGAVLTRRLVEMGWNITVVDNHIRGLPERLKTIKNDIHMVNCDVRDTAALTQAFKNIDVVFHLAAVNGTDNFYKRPELVLDVGIRGALAVVEACQLSGVADLVVASSAEVYQTPPSIPTDEKVPLTLPDSLNPRYSYGGSKILSELIAFNYGQEHFQKVQIFRPHNVYGPDMGYKHVIPQFILRALELNKKSSNQFEIMGTGRETRAFCYVSDIVDGILTMYAKGNHRNIYHIGNNHMIKISELVQMVGEAMGTEFTIVHREAPEGETPIRCPSITKMEGLGYQPKISLLEGLKKTIDWYGNAFIKTPENELL